MCSPDNCCHEEATGQWPPIDLSAGRQRKAIVLLPTADSFKEHQVNLVATDYLTLLTLITKLWNQKSEKLFGEFIFIIEQNINCNVNNVKNWK